MISKIAAISLMAITLSTCAVAETISAGRTYPIVEADALDEITARAERARSSKQLAAPSESWSALRGVHLPSAASDATRHHIPWYTLEVDIPDAAGRIIYPRGYRFNPLEFATLPNKIVVIAEAQVEWAATRLDPAAMVLLTEGDRLAVSKRLDRVVFMLDSRTRERLALRHVPSVVVQRGAELIINEYKTDIE